MPILFANDAASTLQTSVTTASTQFSISSADANLFPEPGASDYFMATVVDPAGNMEIVKCTNRSGAVLTVVRAQEGTTARAFAAGAGIDLRLTKGIMDELRQRSEEIAMSAIAGLVAALGGKLGTGGGDLTGILQLVMDNPVLVLKKNGSTKSATIKGQNGGALRWQLQLGDDAAETGSNTGSNCVLQRGTDAGTLVDVVRFHRDTGWAQFFGVIENINNYISTRNPAATKSAALSPDGAVELKSPTGPYIDFKKAEVDYEFRVSLSGGENALIFDRSDGRTVLVLNFAGGSYGASIGAPDISQFAAIFRRQGGDEGGEIHLEKPATNSVLAGNAAVDVWRNDLRFFEAGGSYRGVFLRLSDLPAGVSSQMAHSNNIRGLMVAGDTQEVGNYVFAVNTGPGVNFGGTVAGSSLQTASTGAIGGGGLNGTWRCHGHAPTNNVTLFERIG